MALFIAIVGCGFVADYYLRTLAFHPELQLIGVTDHDPARLARFAQFYATSTYPDLQALLTDPRIDLVVNLTNPRSHFEVSKACLQAGKHVYSEKPLAIGLHQAEELVLIAEDRGLLISSAPCSVLGESAQTLWKALRDNVIGRVRIVYAEMDDGLVHKMPYQQWLSASGTPWPSKDEFEVGCTIEHAAYYTTWLTAFFGPATNVTAFSACLIPDKSDAMLDPPDAPDFSVACIRFANGVVGRLTCSIVAPHDHRLRIVGDDGVLGVEDSWFYGAPVHVQRMIRVRRRSFMSPFRRRLPLVRKPTRFAYRGAQQMDFCRGIAEMASALAENRPCRLSPNFSLHNNELVLAINNSLETGAPYRMATTFDPIEPMAWATC